MTDHDDPKAPRAVCAKDHTHWLEFSRNPVGEWVCQCPRCEDGVYDRRTDPVGHGQTPLDALENYADNADTEPKELIQGECHV